MRKLLNKFLPTALIAAGVPLVAQNACFKVTSVQPQAGQHPIVLLVATTGDYDAAAQKLFGDPAHWKITYKAENDKTYQDAMAKTVLFNAKSRTFSMAVTSNVIGDGRDYDWTATIDGVDPNCNAGSTSVSLPYPPSGGNLPQDNTFLRPVKPTETATLSLTGSFTAGGGIKPLYAIKEIGNIGAPNAIVSCPGCQSSPRKWTLTRASVPEMNPLGTERASTRIPSASAGHCGRSFPSSMVLSST